MNGALLQALPGAVLLLDPHNCVGFMNLAAEQFFATSAPALLGKPLTDLLPTDSPLFALLGQLRSAGLMTASEQDMALEGPRLGQRFVSVNAASLPEAPGSVVLLLVERSIARKIDHQLTHRGAARSVSAMGAMLAHEVKNPLSGIRGAAQLLESSLDARGRQLTRLICDETDRIVQLVDRMEVFADERPLACEALNVHEVLGHVRRLATSGFGRHLRFVERYDPSLPLAWGNRDLLVQALLNLVKNAAEAAPRDGGEVTLTTRYQQGVRLTAGQSRLELPLVIGVQDNGPGIAEELRGRLFDAFVSNKPNGKGLGLALVAKIVAGHGGIIEFDSEPGSTVFQLYLPMAGEGGAWPQS